MTAKNGNGVVLASGKAKGATGVAAVLTMLTTLTNTEYFAGVLRRVAESCWNDFWEDDWQMEYTIHKECTKCRVQLDIGNSNYLLIDTICRNVIGESGTGTSAYLTVKRMGSDKPQMLSDKPYEVKLVGNSDSDVQTLTTMIGVLVRAIGVPALDGEPDVNPFGIGVVL